MRTIKADLAASLFPIRERFGFRIKIPLSEKLPSLVCAATWQAIPAIHLGVGKNFRHSYREYCSRRDVHIAYFAGRLARVR